VTIFNLSVNFTFTPNATGKQQYKCSNFFLKLTQITFSQGEK